MIHGNHGSPGQSGYRNYNTFALAFKQRMGKSVMEWKQDNQ